MVKQADMCAHILQSRDRSGQPRGPMLLGSTGQWFHLHAELYAVVCEVTYMCESIYDLQSGIRVNINLYDYICKPCVTM